MLPRHLLCLTQHDGFATPAWLTERDAVWIRLAADAFDACVGKAVGAIDDELVPRVLSLARVHGVHPRRAEGLVRVLARRAGDRLVAPVLPPQARAAVFAEAGRDRSAAREVVLGRVAAELRTSPEAVEASLFADRASARRIAPLPSLHPTDLVEAYNLALAQGLLLCSEIVVVHVREHVRAVVRFAKLSGLLCTYAVDDTGTKLEISGPLAVLRHTTKYGFSLARFFPAVLGTPGYAVEARCLVWDTPQCVRIDARDHLAPTHVLPRDADSRVERWLAQDVRRLERGWVLDRESDVVPVGRSVFFPDFTLRRGGASVLVEVVGFHGPSYLDAKVRALEAARGRPLIVCVAATLLPNLGAIPGVVLPFRHRIEAAALLDHAERLVATPGALAEQA
ncbi:MAG: DUF790 family protein [Myxococcales bacterium]|nr:DUF790 family protein [Myxococcales bacterium]